MLWAALVKVGLRPVPQYDVDSYILDFALIRPSGRRLNIEVDQMARYAARLMNAR